MLLARLDHVIPVAVELVSLDVQQAEFLRRDLLACRIATTIELRPDDEATLVGRVADQADDRLVGSQGTATPVDRDEGEQPMLDLVFSLPTSTAAADVEARACAGAARAPFSVRRPRPRRGPGGPGEQRWPWRAAVALASCGGPGERRPGEREENRRRIISDDDRRLGSFTKVSPVPTGSSGHQRHVVGSCRVQVPERLAER
jgi:hypothetical protein